MRAPAQQGAALAALVFIACATGGAPAVTAIVSQDAMEDAPRQALEAADSALATTLEKAGPAAGYWPFLADDALFLEPGLDILRGRDAIRFALPAAQAKRSILSVKMHRVASGRSADAALGYTFGWLEQTPEHGAPKYPKYLAMWRAEAGGWRLAGFVKTSGRGPPSSPPEGNRVVAGYRGVVSPADPAKLAAEIAGADLAFAALADAETTCAAFASFADRDAVAFRSADFHWGIDEVRSAYSGCTPADRATWAPIHSASTGSGDLGFTVGNATFSSEASPSTAAPRSSGTTLEYSYFKYLTVWARQPDGSWRWLLDAGNRRPDPQKPMP